MAVKPRLESLHHFSKGLTGDEAGEVRQSQFVLRGKDMVVP